MIVFNIESAKELEEIIERAVQKVLSDKTSAKTPEAGATAGRNAPSGSLWDSTLTTLMMR